jgi:hypothetical protein
VQRWVDTALNSKDFTGKDCFALFENCFFHLILSLLSSGPEPGSVFIRYKGKRKTFLIPSTNRFKNLNA